MRKIALAAALGALVGLPTLGLGGRLAMFGFARFTARPSIWTVRGTLTVAISGAIAGSIAALMYLAVDRWLLRRTRPPLRGMVFAALVFGIASPGIRPPWTLTFALFAPAFLGFGLLFEACWRRQAIWVADSGSCAGA
jgi:hypothetical protein